MMLEQWRAGLRVSEALDLEVRELSLDTATPTLRVRSGKGGKSRLVPCIRSYTGHWVVRRLTATSARAESSRRTPLQAGGGCRRR